MDAAARRIQIGETRADLEAFLEALANAQSALQAVGFLLPEEEDSQVWQSLSDLVAHMGGAIWEHHPETTAFFRDLVN